MSHTCEISADEALQRRKDGNERFRAGRVRIPVLPLESPTPLARGQSPFATILGELDDQTIQVIKGIKGTDVTLIMKER